MITQSDGSLYRQDLILTKTIHVIARKCGESRQGSIYPRRWQVRRVRVKLAIVVTRVACSVAADGESATRAGVDAFLFDRKPAPASLEGRGQAVGVARRGKRDQGPL